MKNSTFKLFCSYTLLAGALCITKLAEASPIEVVIDHSYAIKTAGTLHSQKYTLIRDGVSTLSGSSSDDFDIARSKAYCDELIGAGKIPHGYCEPNYRFHLVATPNDPSINLLYSRTVTDSVDAWNVTTGSSSVVLAVVDTGVDYSHPDLSANMWTNSSDTVNGADSDGDGFVDDYRGWNFVSNNNDPFDDNEHGTHVAGIMGAVGNNGVGVAGQCWTAKIMPVKVLDAQGSGYLSDIAAGIDFAVKHGANAINLSLGGSSGSAILLRSLQDACTAGVFVAMAAGNEGLNNDTSGSFPANYAPQLNCAVSVAATDNNDGLASFSDYGASSVDFGAPGVYIYSTLPNGLYGYLSGTSMATPEVVGIAGLIKSANSSLHGSDIKQILTNTVDAVSALSGKTITGGRVNAYKAVSAATGTTPAPTPTPDPNATPTPDPGTGDPGSGTDPGTDPGTDGVSFDILTHSATSSRITITGDVYFDSDESALEGERITLTCEDQFGDTIFEKSSTPTTSEGTFGFRITRARQVRALRSYGVLCYVGYDMSFSDYFTIQKKRR